MVTRVAPTSTLGLGRPSGIAWTSVLYPTAESGVPFFTRNQHRLKAEKDNDQIDSSSTSSGGAPP